MFTRFNGNVVPFADDATSTNRTVFGGTTQSDTLDDNLNADFKKGWEIVGLNDNPTREDFNGMGYTLGALTAYLYEMGISEWNASQNYRANSRVTGSDGKIYKSLTGTTGIPNVGNNPTTDAVNWELEFKNFVTLTENQTIEGVKTFRSSPIVPTPTTGTQAVNKDYADLKVALASFTGANQNLTQNGYQKLPSGFIIQWKRGTNTLATGHQTIIFPITFPVTCLHVNVSTLVLGESPSKDSWKLSTYSLGLNNECQVFRNSSDGLGTTPFIIAIGI